MHKTVTSANSVVSKDHKQVDPSAAVYDHQAFATNWITHQQEQEVFPGGTFALDSPPREGTCQDGKNLDAYQEQEAHQDALSQYQCPMWHRTVGHYIVF
jgi:hypothetical protein